MTRKTPTELQAVCLYELFWLAGPAKRDGWSWVVPGPWGPRSIGDTRTVLSCAAHGWLAEITSEGRPRDRPHILTPEGMDALARAPRPAEPAQRLADRRWGDSDRLRLKAWIDGTRWGGPLEARACGLHPGSWDIVRRVWDLAGLEPFDHASAVKRAEIELVRGCPRCGR